MKRFIILSGMILLLGLNSLAHSPGTSYTVLDVRTATEYSSGHAKNAINVDVLDSSFQDKLSKLDKNGHYKVYCRSGNRSGQAERLMRSMGFENVENVGSLQQAIKKLNLACENGGTC